MKSFVAIKDPAIAKVGSLFLPAKHAGQWIIIGPVCLLDSSQGSLYRPEKHGIIGN